MMLTMRPLVSALLFKMEVWDRDPRAEIFRDVNRKESFFEHLRSYSTLHCWLYDP